MATKTKSSAPRAKAAPKGVAAKSKSKAKC